MNTPLKRKLFNAFMSIHILHHAQEEPIYGTWMMEELKRHGYELSYGTLYPLLHSLEKDGFVKLKGSEVENVRSGNIISTYILNLNEKEEYI